MAHQALFIAPSAYPLGGVAVWLDYLAAGLPAHGWDPLVGLVSGRWHDVERYRARYPGLPVLPIDNRTGSREGRIRALTHAIEGARPDLVLGVNIADLYAASRRLGSRGRRPRTVMTLHGIAADLLGDLEREADGLDAVIATNRLACRLCVARSGMPPERVVYAPYGVEGPRLSALPRPAATGTLRIAWAGRLEQDQKRVRVIPEILGHLDRLGVDYRLRIAGDGPDRAALLSSLAPWLGSGRVEYLGALSAKDVESRVYAQSDAFLLTSYWETGPIVIWEAMAAGLAVVSTSYVGSGLEGALRDGENCLLYPVDDSVAAAGRLARLGDPHLRERLARTGRRLVEERYTIARSVRAWAAGLDAILRLPLRDETRSLDAPTPAGRLDRLLGTQLGEALRRRLGLGYAHTEPGGEWPHTAASGSDERLLLQWAAELDLGGGPQGTPSHEA